MENTPSAAPEVPQTTTPSEAPNTKVDTNKGEANGKTETTANTNAPQVSALTTEQLAVHYKITPEEMEEWDRFLLSNGGPKKVSPKVKDIISNPQPKAEAQAQLVGNETVGPQPTSGPNIVTAGSHVPEIQKPAEGYLTTNDIAKLQYNKMLSEAYSELDKEGYITKGEFVKEAASMGIPVMDQAGNMNDAAIRKFLDLKKATIPPTPASAPITTTPTVDYVHTEGDITSQETADAIMKQGTSHPRYNEAMQFTRERIFGKKPESKGTTPQK